MRRLLLTSALVALLAPSAALASGQDVIKDCADDEVIQGTYSQKEYRDALRHLSADLREYTNCEAVIKAAQEAAAAGPSNNGGGPSGGGGAGGPSGSGGGTPSPPTQTPQDREAVRQASTGGGAPVQIGGHQVTPGALGFGAGDPTKLPTSLIVVLVLVALVVGGAAGTYVRNLVLARRAA